LNWNAALFSSPKLAIMVKSFVNDDCAFASTNYHYGNVTWMAVFVLVDVI